MTNELNEIEIDVLGSLINSPNIHLKAFSLLKTDHFISNPHKLIYEQLNRFNFENTPIDVDGLVDELTKSGKIEGVGGKGYLVFLWSRGVFFDITRKVLLLIENYLRRQLKDIGSQLVERSILPTDDPFESINEAERSLSLLITGIQDSSAKAIGQASDLAITEMEEVLKTGKKSGIPTGIKRLNLQTNGWQRGDLVILAGRPGMGKTSAALDFGLSPALEGTPVAFFSLEMTSDQVAGRAMSMLSGVNVQSIVNKTVNQGELLAVKTKSGELKQVPLFIDDTPGLSLISLKNKARRLKREKAIQLIIVDYLQLMKGEEKKGQNRENEISEISRGLKSLAKELGVPVIALSQLNRQNETRADKKPLLSDLRESGAIEQDADMVIFCHRPEYYGQELYSLGGNEYSTRGLFVFIIAKFRNGGLGEIKAKFIGENTLVTNYD